MAGMGKMTGMETGKRVVRIFGGFSGGFPPGNLGGFQDVSIL
jgi:hypothetical protein